MVGDFRLEDILSARKEFEEEIKKKVPMMEQIARAGLEVVDEFNKTKVKSEKFMASSAFFLATLESCTEMILDFEIALYLGVGTPVIRQWLNGARQMRRDYLEIKDKDGFDENCECLMCKALTRDKIENVISEITKIRTEKAKIN